MKRSFFMLLLLAAWSCQQPKTGQPDITAPSPLMCTPPWSDADWYSDITPAPLFDGLGSLHFPISTRNREAQKYFDQGLVLAYAFNHAESARSFYQAIRLDSTCAMCYWGLAYVLGPNYNAGMEPDNFSRAYDAVVKAVKYSNAATDKEKAMIRAMATRYVKDPPANRRQLDSAYMEAMKIVHTQFPQDVDIATLYAESLMDMHPWDLWEKNGDPKPWTKEITDAIQVAIGLNPHHPGGHHFNIHAWEASGTPEKALSSCKVFDDGLIPNAGHLVHMPSHIYIHTGDYHLGSLANIHAVERDSNYVTQCHAQGVYPVAYYPHNYHFLAACATLEGNSKLAIMAASKMETQTHHKGMLMPEMATLQHYHCIPYFIYVKFGRWEDILKIPPLDSSPVYVSGIRHYARGMAFVGLKDLEKANMELQALNEMAKDDTLKKLTIWGINSLYDVIEIAQKVLEGEIAFQQHKYDESIALFQEGVTLEDQLNYNEPPDWFFAVRHHLGASLLQAGKASEGIRVYEQDLKKFPGNGWSLNGLKDAYTMLKQTDQAKEAEAQFKIAWANADVTLVSSKVR